MEATHPQKCNQTPDRDGVASEADDKDDMRLSDVSPEVHGTVTRCPSPRDAATSIDIASSGDTSSSRDADYPPTSRRDAISSKDAAASSSDAISPAIATSFRKTTLSGDANSPRDSATTPTDDLKSPKRKVSFEVNLSTSSRDVYYRKRRLSSGVCAGGSTDNHAMQGNHSVTNPFV